MAIDSDDLQRRLCGQLCATVRVERRPDGDLMLDSGFRFPDGDSFPICLSEGPGCIRLSGRGDTLMRISYEHRLQSAGQGTYWSIACTPQQKGEVTNDNMADR